MTAEEYFDSYWQEANREKFGDYGDYSSDEYAIAFANDYAALRIADVGLSLPSKRNCFECNEELNKEELFCSYCRRQ